MRASLVVMLAVLVGVVGCSDDESNAAAGQAGGTGGGGGTGGSSTALCDASILAEPQASVTYWVATEQQGADNDACDGLAPTDEGNGRCPWRDFDAPALIAVLDDTADVRVEVRSGTYVIRGWDGLLVNGAGATADEPLVLSAFPGEEPIFDVPKPDGAGCTEATAPNDPQCVRQVVRVSGRHVTLQGLTIHNGLGYHLEVLDADGAMIRCNRIAETVPFDMRSDLMKVSGSSSNVEIRNNEFSQFRSQAIDMTAVGDILVENNEFHHPFDLDAGAVGMKLGISRVTIRDNDIHDFGADPTNQHVFSLGGEGTPADLEYLASEIEIVGNRVWNVPGILAQLVSCRDCSVLDNSLWDSGAGVFVSAAAVGDPQCEASPTGCPPSYNVRIEGNRFRNMVGDGTPSTPEVFVWSEAGAIDGLVAGSNVYCANDLDKVDFGWEGQALDFDAWKMQTATDSSSKLTLGDDPACSGW